MFLGHLVGREKKHRKQQQNNFIWKFSVSSIFRGSLLRRERQRAREAPMPTPHAPRAIHNSNHHLLTAAPWSENESRPAMVILHHQQKTDNTATTKGTLAPPATWTWVFIRVSRGLPCLLCPWLRAPHERASVCRSHARKTQRVGTHEEYA